MSVLTLENISKTYGEKILFQDINMHIDSDDKIGLIGINGTGKSSFLKVISGEDSPDSGKIIASKHIKIEMLSQNLNFDKNASVIEQVFKYDSPSLNLIRDYEKFLDLTQKDPLNQEYQDKLLDLITRMNAEDAWDLESKIKTILTKLGIRDFESKISTLSGGQKRRIALAAALINPCDLLILDEPTNHMDNDTIDWLENFLANRKGALLMVTHDRYFLDNVANKILELDGGSIYEYTGNYTTYVQAKLDRKEIEAAIEQKKNRLYKKELEWIRKGARARTTKQKARIKRFESIEDSLTTDNTESLDISLSQNRLGKKIIEIEDLNMSFGDKLIIDNFNHIFTRKEQIGIVGKSGIGKTTLLNLIMGSLKPDSGNIIIGDTVKIGYFSQESESMNEDLRAIDYIKERAEYIHTSDNQRISASQMMERFLFTGTMQWTYIKNLSGGEKRRLFLLRILMDSPNVLILDEPTNDLDIETLKVLENYIDDFTGTVITVSHDRYFLDRTSNRIFYFSGNGKIVKIVGNYTDLVSSEYYNTAHDDIKNGKEIKEEDKQPYVRQKKLKLSYKEEQEFKIIYDEIESLENKIDTLEKEISNITSDYVTLQELNEEKEKMEDELLFKLEREEFLQNKIEEIKAQK